MRSQSTFCRALISVLAVPRVLLALLVAAGCGGTRRSGETSVLLEVAPTSAPGAIVPHHLRLSAWDEHGTAWRDERLPAAGPLVPKSDALLGTVVLYPGPTAASLRLLVRAVAIGGATATQVTARVVLVSGAQVKVRVALADATPGDGDGDGVPDAIDICPAVFDPEQDDAEGSGVGDACRPGADGGPPDAADAGAVDVVDVVDAGPPDDVPAEAGDDTVAHDADDDAPVSDAPASDALAPLGAPCGGAGACASGFCADGVCCDGACVDACKSCARPGKVGLCSFEALGTVCAPGACTGSTQTLARTCDGAGTCLPASMVSCAPYACAEAGACHTSCTLGMHCTVPNVCRPNGTCGTKKLDGDVCAGGGDCESGFCVDLHCCETACTDLCRTCGRLGQEGKCLPVPADLPDANSTPSCSGAGLVCDGAGRCNKPSGTSCAVDAECSSLSCAMGVCA